ncbi:DNA-binding transcriptional LysR family regulator [Pseudomonas duriflava]|uniref:DNA-binding transcriptional LysR family regulator n=1 Tax=Pseudomonas duriflava TaxID=459528 RepID=A0A562QF64_9PSED|nr:LysR family transcriptional regulator [Pseudomonas duriflava]TWI54810.1 DNA-binding transcriptional LysR family regulator [Pseudomonas duriflava]
MNLRFLETFVWVARLGSFRLTAEKLSSTQAAISSRIAVLESELGVQLFLRDPRGVTLTADGQKVLVYAERMIDTWQDLRQGLGQTSRLSGRVRIGVMDTVIHSWLSAFFAAVTEAHPEVEIELVADTALNLSEQLLKGQLDLIFQTDLLRADSVRNLKLASYPVGWIVAVNSPLDQAYDSIEALARERLITFSRHSRPHQDLLNFLHQQSITVPRVSCVNSVAAIIQLVHEGFGIGVLPPALVNVSLAQGALRLLELETPPPFAVYASWHTGVGLSLNEALVALSRQVVGEFCQQFGPGQAVLA